jgi:hypothetical protein
MIARMEEATVRRRLDSRRVTGVVAAAAVGLVVAVVVWLVLDLTDDETTRPAAQPPATAAPAPAATALQPAVVSEAELRRLATVAGVPVYWAGTRSGTSLEVSRGTDGSFFVRYLPDGRSAGDARPALTVATYPRADGFDEVTGAAARADASSFELPGGGLAVADTSTRTNVHLAFPGRAYQVEVFSPVADVARRLVASGAVSPLG